MFVILSVSSATADILSQQHFPRVFGMQIDLAVVQTLNLRAACVALCSLEVFSDLCQAFLQLL